MQEPTEAPSVPFKHGKVKDVYNLGKDQLLFVFSDRVSAYDVRKIAHYRSETL